MLRLVHFARWSWEFEVAGGYLCQWEWTFISKHFCGWAHTITSCMSNARLQSPCIRRKKGVILRLESKFSAKDKLFKELCKQPQYGQKLEFQNKPLKFECKLGWGLKPWLYKIGKDDIQKWVHPSNYYISDTNISSDFSQKQKTERKVQHKQQNKFNIYVHAIQANIFKKSPTLNLTWRAKFGWITSNLCWCCHGNRCTNVVAILRVSVSSSTSKVTQQLNNLMVFKIQLFKDQWLFLLYK